MNDLEHINVDLAGDNCLDVAAPQPTDEVTEIEAVQMEQVSGGGDGTAMGWS